MLIPSSCSNKMLSYPEERRKRSQWVLERRGERNRLDPWKPYEYLAEPECGPDGNPVEVATLFLTNRECPFRCVMCDLWKNTLAETVPPGAIPDQIRFALGKLPPARHVKLYNAGSFFDPRAIPPDDYPEIATLVAGFDRVIVECHPAFIGPRTREFQSLLRTAREASTGHSCQTVRATHLPPESGGRGGASLEVAIGLETAHPDVLDRLNKRMTVDRFRRAAAFLREHAIDLRVFLLVRPPWLSEEEGLEWACRSLDLAFDCSATVCTLIPTRSGNGAMDALATTGQFAPPSLASLEAALDYGLSLRRGRVFADVWDIGRFATCPHCAEARVARLERLNLTQRAEPPVSCGCRSEDRRGAVV